MWKFYWDLLCWSFSGAWAVVGVIATGLGIIGGFIVWLSPKWETPMKNLFWIIPAFILLAFFSIRMFQAPYHFYSEKQQEIDDLKRQLNDLGFEIKIGSMVIVGEGDSTRLELSATAINRGNPSTAHDWSLCLITSTREFEAVYTPGRDRAKGSPNIPPIDNILRQPLGTNDEIPGLINFLLPKIQQKEVELLTQDPKAKLLLSVLDNKNRKWTGERNIAEMAAERNIRFPSK